MAIEDTIISSITDVKYFASIMPTESPFCETISATSPRVIMPTPTLRLSRKEYFIRRAVRPQPMTFVSIATSTKHTEKSSSSGVKPSKRVLMPMLAKNTGPNIM